MESTVEVENSEPVARRVESEDTAEAAPKAAN
jgi:hypothetical protein